MIRSYGKILNTKGCKVFSSQSWGNDSCDFEQQSLKPGTGESVAALLTQKFNLKSELYFDLITAKGEVSPHTDKLSGLSRTAYLIPVKLPKHTKTFLIEGEQKVEVIQGCLYTFNQWNEHYTTFSKENCIATTVWLCVNLINNKRNFYAN
jgi:hypothetical protein